MALFSWKKQDDKQPSPPSGSAPASSGSDAAPGVPSENGQPSFSPEKASKFFQHARTVDEATNYEYAAQLWLSGIRWDPNSMEGLVGFFQTIARFNETPSGKKGVSKDVVKTVSGKGDVDRYALALLEWGQRPTESVLAVRAAEAAARLGIKAPTRWITERAFGIAVKDKKPRKDLFLKCSECFGKADAFELALGAAEHALKMDPTDGELAARIRNLAAQATMSKGGFENTGKEGGFRSNIRDAAKQRQLEDADRIVKTEDTLDRLISAAEEEMVRRPGDLPTTERYGKHLLERGRPADEEKVHALYMATFESTKQFRFREMAGDIRIRQSRRKVTELRDMLAKSPDSEMIQRMVAQAEQEHNQLEADEFKLRCENYPTDLTRKFELGKRYFALGQYHEAIEQFQEAQHEPRNRAAAMGLLGQSFQRINWNEEAVDTFRHALDIKDLLPDTLMELRYHLMTALQAKAEAEADVAAAEEADRLASAIARQQMSYRDIRTRRDAIKALLLKLRGRGDTPPSAGGAV